MALPEVGVQVVAKGAEVAQKQLSAFNRSVESTQKAVSGGSKSLGGFTSAAADANAATGAMSGGLAGLAQNFGFAALAGGGIVTVLQSILSVEKRAIEGFIALGKQSIQIESISRAFSNTFAGIGSGTDILKSLQQQVRGTISNVELMRQAVATLRGTDAQFKQIVGTQFGAILDATNRIAQATGESADVIREKFVRGLRLSSKRLVDDTGVLVNITKANEEYAKSIGKTAAALTDEEKRAAFAAAAITKLQQIASGLGERNTTADSIAQITASFQNMKDILASALTPLFESVFGIAAKVVMGLQSALQVVAPLLRELASIAGGVLTAAFNGFTNALGGLEPFWNNFKIVLPYLIALVRVFGQGLIELSGIIGNVLGKTIAAFFPKMGALTEKGFADLAFRFARGAGRIVGAFAKGFADGAKYVLQAVTLIAQIVADFLEGFSPPKKGPLKDIDKGAQRVAEAWADGFAMMNLEPVDNVLAQVNARLGDIGTFTREQVGARLEALDLAIRPFVEQLDIVKSDFEAIAGFADPALKAIDRQRSRLLQLAGRGSLIDINQLRTLDRQADYFNELQDSSQGMVDNAQIQLAVAQSQQAQERALLSIQKRRLGEAEKAASGSTATNPATGTGTATPTDVGTGAIPIGGSPLDLIDMGSVDDALANLQAGFQKGLLESGAVEAIAGATGQMGKLGTQLDRIKKADPVAKLKDKFKGLESISKPFEAAQKAIDIALKLMGIGFDILGTQLDKLTANFSFVLPTAVAIFKGAIDGNLLPSLNGLVDNLISKVFPNLVTLGNKLGLSVPLATTLFKSGIFDNVTTPIIEMLGWIEGFLFPDFDTFSKWFSIDLPFAFDDFLASLLLNVVNPLLDLEKTISDKVEQAFRRLVRFVSETFKPVLKKVNDEILVPLSTAFDDVKTSIDNALDSLGDLASGLLDLAIPDWIQRHSPPPLATAFKEVNTEMKRLRIQSLKPLSMEFAKLPTPSAVLPQEATQYGYSGGGATSNTYDNSRSTDMGGVSINVSSPQEALWVKQHLIA